MRQNTSDEGYIIEIDKMVKYEKGNFYTLKMELGETVRIWFFKSKNNNSFGIGIQNGKQIQHNLDLSATLSGALALCVLITHVHG